MPRINRNVNYLFAWPKMHLNVTDNVVPQGTNLISVNYRFWNAFMYRLTLAIPSDSYPVWWDGAEDHRMLFLIIESHPDCPSSTKMTHKKVSLFTFYKQYIYSARYKLQGLHLQADKLAVIYSKDTRGRKSISSSVCVCALFQDFWFLKTDL